MIRLRRYPLLPVLLFLLLSGCAGGLSSSPDRPQESEYIDLEEPIVLDLNVLPMQVVYPDKVGQERNSLRSFSSKVPSYTSLTQPTVNTKKQVVDLYNEDVFGNVDIPKKFFTLDITGYDHIKSLSIPELRPEQYRVEGLVPTDPYRQDPDMPGSTLGEDLPGKVTVTLYSIPRGGTMTFLANARVYRNCYPDLSDRPKRKIGDLDLENPYFLVFNPRYQMNGTVSTEFSNIRGTSLADAVVEPENEPQQYIPMYGRLYNVRRDPDDPHKLLGSESEHGVPAHVHSVGLERALSLLFVRSLPQSLTTGNDGIQFYDGDYLIEYCNVGVRCNVVSILPSNWEGVKKQPTRHIAPINAEKGTPLPLYDYIGRSQLTFDYRYRPFDEDEIIRAANANILSRSCLLIGENFPARPEDQNTLHLEVTKFKGSVHEDKDDPDTSVVTYKLVSKRGEYVYHVPYGEVNTNTGLMEIHRNRIYVIAIDLKKLVRARNSFDLDSWQKDYDIEIGIRSDH